MSGPLGDIGQYEQQLRAIFEQYGVVLAYLYGSQARGDAGPLSDVDVAVLFGPNVPKEEWFDRLLVLIGELVGLFHRDDVYVVDLAEASPLLRHRVYWDGRLLCRASEADRVRFETAVRRDYVDTEPLRRIKRGYIAVERSLQLAAQAVVDIAAHMITSDYNARVQDYCDPGKVYDVLIHGRADLEEFGRHVVAYLQRSGALEE